MGIKVTIRDAATIPRVTAVPQPKSKGPSQTYPADVLVTNEGTIVLLRPNTQRAKDWIAEHTPKESMWFGPSLVVEPRYVDDIIDGMTRNGLEVA